VKSPSTFLVGLINVAMDFFSAAAAVGGVAGLGAWVCLADARAQPLLRRTARRRQIELVLIIGNTWGIGSRPEPSSGASTAQY
jgi:hypothetical protein